MPDEALSMLKDPMSILAFLAGVVSVIFWLSSRPALRKLFDRTPPVMYVYFVPMFATTLGITPDTSPVYTWTNRYLLPFALLLLMLSIDLKSVARLGPTALFMIVTGTVGIIVGAPVALLLFGGILPEDAWMGFAALSGSWIGGTANMVAIADSVGMPESMYGPIIVVDTVVGYGWIGILLFFSAYQKRFDEATGARTDAIEETNRRLQALDAERQPLELWHAIVLIGIGFVGAVAAAGLGDALPTLGEPTVISHTTWAILLVVTGGLLLSFTPIRELDRVGASQFGYVALYLLLAAIGARADLKAVAEAPVYLAAGAVWLAVHAAILLLAARLVRAPLFFVATGSTANVGGAASAPVVAGVYHRAMAPVGLLMAVAGYVLGIYGALLCAWILSQIGG